MKVRRGGGLAPRIEATHRELAESQGRGRTPPTLRAASSASTQGVVVELPMSPVPMSMHSGWALTKAVMSSFMV